MADLKQPLSQSPDNRDHYGGFRPSPQKKDTHKDEEDTLPPPNKQLRFSQEPSNSDGSAGQEVQEQRPLVRPPEESSGDGTVRQEVQDVEVDPFPDAHSGPSRTTSEDDVPQGTMEKPPNEILQFISWKRLYYQYLNGFDHALLILQFILKRYGLTKDHPQCMLGLIRCASAVRTCHCQDPTAALACLNRHPLFPKAELCIAKRLPDLDDRKEQPAYVRAVMAAIVLLAGGVCDVQELVGCLRRPCATMSQTDTLEMLYCMATLLYAMRENEVQISNRLHYSVFYCLYHLENLLLNDPELSSSERDLGSPDLQLTREQQKILDHAIAPGQRVKIVALAGTGKTSTLIQYARKWSNLKFLYLAFNRTIAEQASQVFPANVTCKTTHSLALEEINKNYQDMKHYDLGSLTSYEVSLVLSNPNNRTLLIARGVAETLKNFFTTADESITVEHVPISYRTDPGGNVEASKEQIILEEAKQIWSKMETLDPTLEMGHRVTHDGYLKYLQLKNPSISNYDVILVDGVEDFTPAMMDIILRQKCGVILVGDPHQHIYTFRGADNTGFNVHDSCNFKLTQSFRFGYEIAYVGATLLDIYKKVRNKTLVGNNQQSDVSEVHMERKVARLSRTKKTVFENAVAIIDKNSSVKIHFLGGYKSIGLTIIQDLWKLLHPELKLEINNSFLKAWKGKSFTSIKEYAKEEDKVLERYITIVEKYQDIPQLVQRIKGSSTISLETADYILGTVHMAKGQEFDTVQIDDDFVRVPTERISENGWNLLYIAVTRAKKRLIMSRYLIDMLKEAKEYRVRFELATAQGNMTPLVCSEGECRKFIPVDSLLIPKRIHFVYTDSTETPAKFVCPSCAWRKYGPIAQLAGSSRMQQVVARLPEDIGAPPEEVFNLLEDF